MCRVARVFPYRFLIVTRNKNPPCEVDDQAGRVVLWVVILVPRLLLQYPCAGATVCVSCPRRLRKWLCQGEDKDLCGEDAQEHGERIYCCIGYRGGIVVGYLVAVSECRGIGASSRHETHKGVVVELEVSACYRAYDEQGNDGDEEAPQYPHKSAIEDGLDKFATGSYTYAGKEEAYTYFAQHEVGTCRSVGGEVEFVSVSAYEDGDDERAAGKSQLQGNGHSGNGEGHTTEDNTHHDTYEDGEEVGVVEVFHRVAQLLGESLDVLLFTHYGNEVTHLQGEVGVGQEIDTGTCHAGDVELITHAQAHRTEFATVVLLLRHDDAS